MPLPGTSAIPGVDWMLERPEGFEVLLPESTLPQSVRDGLASGTISRILVIGQGTAAVAGESLAYCLSDLMAEAELSVQALPATELSGFHLRRDMSDTLAIAISQSGTTTDTNRTVDILRDRGARIMFSRSACRSECAGQRPYTRCR